MLMYSIKITLEGLSDVLFDKFWDHSKEDRPPEQKLYLEDDNTIVLPGSNLHAFIFNQKKGGCITTFEGKGAKDYYAREGFVNVVERSAPFLVKGDKPIQYKGNFKKPLFIINESGVTGAGKNIVKQPIKPRPGISTPWKLKYTMTLVENDLINVQKLYNWISKGGLMVGLGTWRPRFGRFLVSQWDVSQSGESEPLTSIPVQEDIKDE